MNPYPSNRLPVSPSSILPLGVTGNTPDSGSGESWFEPRRGNSKRDATMRRVALRRFSPECHRFCHRFSRHHFDITRRGGGFCRVACKRFSGVQTQSNNGSIGARREADAPVEPRSNTRPGEKPGEITGKTTGKTTGKCRLRPRLRFRLRIHEAHSEADS